MKRIALATLIFALAGAALTGVIHQDEPHQVRRHAEKVRPVLPVLLALVDHAQVGFMRERGRLQCMVRHG